MKRLFRDKNLNRLEDISIDEKDYTKFADTIKKEFYELKKNKDYNPSEDYYDYVNHGWLKEETKKLKEDPKYYVEVDDFRVVQDKVYDEVLAYTNEYIKQNKGKRKAESIKAVQHCIVKADKKLGLEHCHRLKKQIDQFIFMEDMYGLLAYSNQDEIFSWQAPIVWNIKADEKNVTKYISSFESTTIRNI